MLGHKAWFWESLLSSSVFLLLSQTYAQDKSFSCQRANSDPIYELITPAAAEVFRQGLFKASTIPTMRCNRRPAKREPRLATAGRELSFEAVDNDFPVNWLMVEGRSR